MNFTYTLLNPAHGTWGSLTDQNDFATFNGMIGMLQRNEIDMALEFAVTADRSRAIDFSESVLRDQFIGI